LRQELGVSHIANSAAGIAHHSVLQEEAGEAKKIMPALMFLFHLNWQKAFGLLG
jgi:hypothetical protein